MTTRTLVIVAVLVAGLGLEPRAQTSPQVLASVGVLVGIHKPGDHESASAPPVPSSLRTIWLDTDPSATPVLPRLLVPRSSGFWWLGLISTCSEQARKGPDATSQGVEVEISEVLWSSPTGVRPLPELPAAEWNCRSSNISCYTHYGTGIDWVWPDFISMSSVGESSCEPNPELYSPEVYRLNDLDTPLTVGAVFGRSAEARMQRAYDRATREYRSRRRGDSCDDPNVFSPRAWHIERQAGRWLIEGWAQTGRRCEDGISYSADVDFSRITGSRVVRERPLSGSVSGVKDAIASDDGRWVLLIRQDEVVLSPRESPDKPIATAPLSIGDTVVMAEWSHGRNVARWREQVRTLAEP